LVEKFPFVIGRSSSSDQPLQLVFISRHHCRFSLNGETVFVEDMGSSNGTYVNGVRLASPTPIRHGDEVRLGPLGFRVNMQVMPDKMAAAGMVAQLPNEASTVLVPPTGRHSKESSSSKTVMHASNFQAGHLFG